MGSLFHKRLVFPLLHALRRDWPYAKLGRLESSQWASPAEIKALQNSKLVRVMEAASRHPLHRARFAEAGVDWRSVRSVDDLDALPVLEKSELAAFQAESKHNPPPGFIRQTSGTSGVPLRIPVDRSTSSWSHATRMRCYRWYGVDVGDREGRLWGRAASGRGVVTAVRNALLNRRTYSSQDLYGEALADSLSSFSAANIDYVYGYASLIRSLGRAIEEAHDDWFGGRALAAVICTAEEMASTERHELSRIFRCPVVSEYGCSEVDIIAFECPQGSMHVQAENLHVETVPDPDTGHPGSIVLTDLNNVAIPLLRYRLGDFVELSTEPCPCGRGLPVLSSILGRSSRRFILLPSGGTEHASILAHAVEKAVAAGHSVLVFRVTQTDGRTLDGEIVARDGFDRDAFQQFMARELSPLIDSGLELRWRYPDEIRRVHGEKFSYFQPLQENS